MRRVLFLAAMSVAVVSAQGFRWVWRDTTQTVVTWYGDQGSGSTVILCRPAALEQQRVAGLTAGGSAGWTQFVDSVADPVGCMGASGSFYLGGKHQEPSEDYEPAVVALTSGGSVRWQFFHDSPHTGNDDQVTCLAANRQGKVYAGATVDYGNWPNHAIISIDDADGHFLDSVDVGGHVTDLNMLTCGPSGEVYALGSSYDADADWELMRWNGSGDLNWFYIFRGAPGGSDQAHSMVLSSGALNVVGQIESVPGQSSFAVLQLNAANGDRNWSGIYANGGRGAVGWDVACDDGGNVYALGDALDSLGGQDMVVLALTPGGSERWSYRFDPGGNHYAWAKSIKVGSDGDVYAFGDCSNSSYNSDMVIVSLTPDGNRRWVYNYDGGMNDYCAAYCGLCSSDGELYTAGSTQDANGYMLAVVSVDPDAGVAENPGSTRKDVLPGSMFARGVLRLEKGGGTLFDVRGREVAGLRAGSNDISRLAPGAYFVRSRESGALARVTVVK